MKSAHDKAILVVIAISQLLLSLIFLEIALVYGLSPFLAILGVWGLINACALFTSNALARVAALLWHVAFVGYVFISLMSGPHKNASDNFILVWAMFCLGAIFYLAKTSLHYFRNKSLQP